MNLKTLILTTLLTATIPAAAVPQQRVGLVLSGGGAKGIAHAGVIQALEENDIAIDYVAGTSMGAIVGGLYSCGYSPEEMMELFTSPQFSFASTGQINPDMVYYFSAPTPSPVLFTLSLGNDSIARQVPQSLISPVPMNYEFIEIFAPSTARCDGDFNKLMVPFRCVASNVEGRHKEVFASGQVGDAIRASMTFPIVFSPIAINDTLLYDGGIYENFPVETMRDEFHPDVMIGVDVHAADRHPTPTALNQISNMVEMPQSYELPADEGIKIRVNLDRFSLLDFPKAEEIYEIGYRRGLEMADSIKSRISARRSQEEVANRRNEFRRSLPEMRFGSVTTTGGTKAQNEFVDRMFMAHGKKIFNSRQARDGFYRAVSTRAFANLYPQARFNPATGLFDLSLHAYPKSPWSVGLGGYITSSTNSMLYAAIGFNSLGNTMADASLGAWIGQNYAAAQLLATVRLGPQSHPYSGSIQAVVSRRKFFQDEQLFFRTGSPDFVTGLEAFVRAYILQLPAGRHAVTSLSAGYGYLHHRYYDSSGLEYANNHSLGQLALRYDYTTLNAVNYPTSGLAIHAAAMGLLGRTWVNATPGHHVKWLQISGNVAKYFNLHKHFALGLTGEAMISTRELIHEYFAAITSAASFNPTPSSANSFNVSFRANSFIAAGVAPIWKATSSLQLRGSFNIFTPWQKIESARDGSASYSRGYLNHPEFFGEIAAVYTLPFASLSAYGNYRTGIDHGWNCGVSLGVFLTAPKFLK